MKEIISTHSSAKLFTFFKKNFIVESVDSVYE